MSIVWSLKRLFDPFSHYWEESERHAEGEEPRRTREGDPPDFEVAPQEPARARAPTRFRCRVCDYTSSDDGYCPTCLADTMQAD